MKFAIPEISWHNRDPVLSVDFQPKRNANDLQRLATGGTDSHVLIWYISTSATGAVTLEVAADLSRHQKAVNVVRWSPSGELLASGDDESIIFVWRLKEEEPAPMEQGEEQYKETWVIFKTLRGHMEDVLDLSWSRSSLHLASGSVDNKLILWDVTRGKHTAILTDHKGFVQGVAWDPQGQIIATASTDRVFRTFDISTKKVTSRSSQTVLPFPLSHPLHSVPCRLYHDDTLQTYYRRLQFSPDGLLVAVPAGRIEAKDKDTKPVNAVYIYTRYCLKTPVCILPSGDPALVTRWSPVSYALKPGPSALPLDKRMVLAVGTKRSVLVYDTQQKTPIAIISNIHYTRLTDLSWSPDGLTLVASSTDGFCSVVSFTEGELGEVYIEPVKAPLDDGIEPMDVDQPEQLKPEEPNTKTTKPDQPKLVTPKIDASIKFKSPTTEKSPKTTTKTNQKDAKQKTPVKLDCLVETAMPSWSDNSNNEIIKPEINETMKPENEIIKPTKDDEIMIIEDSEDIKLVYEDSQDSQENRDLKNAETESKDITNESKDATNINKDIPKIDKDDSNVNKSIANINKNNVTANKDSANTNKDDINPIKSLDNTKSEPKTISPTNKNNFFSQAKVTDVKEPAKAIPSPKAPRRVSFVTLSSPKSKKC